MQGALKSKRVNLMSDAAEPWYKKLEKDYPGLATYYPECNDGWEALLREFFDVVKANVTDPDQFSLSQIKEKWGGLVIYYHLGDDLSDEAIEAIQQANDTIEKKSWKTCELTGKPGALIRRRGWMCVRAPELWEPGDELLDKSVPAVQAELAAKLLAERNQSN